MTLKAAPVAALAAALCVCGCLESDQQNHDRGYKDGYKAGFETYCGPKAHLIEGDFEREPYRDGLQKGYADGVAACRAKGE